MINNATNLLGNISSNIGLNNSTIIHQSIDANLSIRGNIRTNGQYKPYLPTEIVCGYSYCVSKDDKVNTQQVCGQYKKVNEYDLW